MAGCCSSGKGTAVLEEKTGATAMMVASDARAVPAAGAKEEEEAADKAARSLEG